MTDPPATSPGTTSFLRGWRIARFGIVSCIGLGLMLPSILAAADGYARFWLQLACCGALLVIVSAEGVLLTLDRPWGVARWPAGIVTLGISAVSTVTLAPPALLSTAHWSISYVGWLGVVLFADISLSLLVGFLALHYGLSGFVLVAAGQAGQQEVTHLLFITISIGGFQIALGAAARALRRIALAADSAARREHEVATSEAVAEALHSGRSERYEALRDSVVPLLRDLADDRIRPSDPGVRQRCALEAARMRRLFAEGDDAADPLGNELSAALDVAERRGVVVTRTELGGRVLPPRETRRVLIDRVATALLGAARTARVTISGPVERAGVVIDVVTDGAPAEHEPERHRRDAGHGVRLDTASADERVWTRAEWHATQQEGSEFVELDQTVLQGTGD